jgi:hypothetical protein
MFNTLQVIFSLLMKDIGNEATQVKMCAFLITLLQVSFRRILL